MYMPHPHHHNNWKEKRNKWNDNIINQRKLKVENENVQPYATSKPNKLTLFKSLSTALTKKSGISNSDASIIF